MKHYGKILLCSVFIFGVACPVTGDEGRLFVKKELDKILKHEDAFPKDSLQRLELKLLEKKIDKFFQAKEESKIQENQSVTQQDDTAHPPKPTKLGNKQQSYDYYDVMQGHSDIKSEYQKVMQFQKQVHDKYIELQQQLADINSYKQARQSGQDLSNLKIQTADEFTEARNHYIQSLQEHEALKAKYLHALNKYNERKGMYQEIYNAYKQ